MTGSIADNESDGREDSARQMSRFLFPVPSRYVLSKEHGTVAVGPAAKKEWHGLTLQVGGIEP